MPTVICQFALNRGHHQKMIFTFSEISLMFIELLQESFFFLFVCFFMFHFRDFRFFVMLSFFRYGKYIMLKPL